MDASFTIPAVVASATSIMPYVGPILLLAAGVVIVRFFGTKFLALLRSIRG